MPPLGKGEAETCVLNGRSVRSPAGRHSVRLSLSRLPVAVPFAVLRIAINERAQTEFSLANTDLDAILFQFRRCAIPIWTLRYSDLDAVLFRFRRYAIPNLDAVLFRFRRYQ